MPTMPDYRVSASIGLTNARLARRNDDGTYEDFGPLPGIKTLIPFVPVDAPDLYVHTVDCDWIHRRALKRYIYLHRRLYGFPGETNKQRHRRERRIARAAAELRKTISIPYYVWSHATDI